jgi:glycosyltransferase A (GT-A) superfamily protein (DUF2064 family)
MLEARFLPGSSDLDWLNVSLAPTAILLAKLPRPGAVKTRLTGTGGLSAAEAAEVALAMLCCSVERLAARWTVVVAITPDGTGDRLLAALGGALPAEIAARLQFVDQGEGDLGVRLGRAWRAVGSSSPVAFFGADTPDLPASHLEAIERGLVSSDVAIGPTPDGGYWTLASRDHRPGLLARVDWGSESVYDQTCDRAAAGGLRLESLPGWPDVDRPADVIALRERLAGTHPDLANDAVLARLAERLGTILASSDLA